MTFAPVLLRHNLSLAEALGRVGVKGGQVPSFIDGIQPVVIMANLAETYSGEPLEGRGLVAGISPAVPVGRRGWYRLHSLAPGGIVVEVAAFLETGGPSPYVFVDVLPAPPAGATELPMVLVQSGGAVARSQSFIGDTTAAPSGAGPADFSVFFTSTASASALKLYVPNGSDLCVWTNDPAPGAAMQLTVRLIFREIPAPIAPP